MVRGLASGSRCIFVNVVWSGETSVESHQLIGMPSTCSDQTTRRWYDHLPVSADPEMLSIQRSSDLRDEEGTPGVAVGMDKAPREWLTG